MITSSLFHVSPFSFFRSTCYLSCFRLTEHLFFSSIPFIYYLRCLRPSVFFFPSLLAVTQIRGHIAGSSPPLPTTIRVLYFYREETLALPSSTRVEMRLPPTLRGAHSSSSSSFFFCKNAKSDHGGIRTPDQRH